MHWGKDRERVNDKLETTMMRIMPSPVALVHGKFSACRANMLRPPPRHPLHEVSTFFLEIRPTQRLRMSTIPIFIP